MPLIVATKEPRDKSLLVLLRIQTDEEEEAEAERSSEHC